MNNWISVKDRLPEDCDKVLIYYGGNYLIGTFMNEDKGFDCGYDCFLLLNEVTHWQELPEPPKEDK